MQRDKNQISSLLAARINTVRRAPRASTAPFLSLSHGPSASEDESFRETTVTGQSPSASDQIHDLLTRLQVLMDSVAQKSRQDIAGQVMLQACIDKSVDAVEALLIDTKTEGSRLFGELRALDFFAVRSGGCLDLSRNRLPKISKIIEKSISLFSNSHPSPAADQAASENSIASRNATTDEDFTTQISKLTQLDILAHTCNQHRTPFRADSSSILEVIPSE